MIRRFGDVAKSERRYVHRPGAYAVIARQNAVLLTYQAAPFHEYQLPGGGIDSGEHLLPALHREVMEETGWRVRIRRKLGVFRRFTYMPDYDIYAEKLCHIYLATPATCHGPATEMGHHAVWMPVEEAIPRLSNGGDVHFLTQWANRR